ncbi:DUF3750 domain-containing protein [Jannaschia ovalis]|uniref:DUF3750 domain-containing protein n=1 Tax=Jannaschia ovalis TaxID=3038773 RepID=A0ABY8LIC2_9RHOB|nr:DUF3750 domain-containing protein [Jannaschia sp. GRR-S6-38]WGH79843.1 DUF3750 domain-containing protein [Jannaschia sp. GRR-S6-38]
MLAILAATLRWSLLGFTLAFLLPVFAASLWWALQDRPDSWRNADWGPSGVLPPAQAVPGAAIRVMAARTGGAKGAVSVHSWIVHKRAGAARWTRHDVVGWGRPVRRDAYAADARWYSNLPQVIGAADGSAAATLIPRLEAAIAAYPFAGSDAYRIFPGPNSNTFTAHLLRELPELGVTLPPHAVGRDFLGEGPQLVLDEGGDLHASISGLAGFTVGPRAGVELHLLGQAVGLDIMRPALKLPAIGRLGLSPRAQAAELPPG